MPLHTLLRSSSATWGLPLVVGFIVLFLGEDLTAWTTIGYWPGVTGAATFALAFVAPACAASGAWEASRLHRGRVAEWAPSRSRVVTAAWLLAPVVAMGVLAMGVALTLVALDARPGAGLPHVGILAVWLAVVCSHAVGGFLLGRVAPLAVAAPLALVGSFLISAYPPAMEPVWMRHLTGGGLRDCCALSQVPDTHAISSALLVGGGMVLASLALLARRRVAAIACSAFVLATGIALGSYVAMNAEATASTDRSSRHLQCSGAQPQVCVWPELAPRADHIRKTVSDVHDRLTGAGVPVPATFTTSWDPAHDELSLGIDLSTPDTVIAAAAATSLMPNEPPACALAGEDYPGYAAFGPLSAWLETVAGVDATERAGRYDREDGALAMAVAGESGAVQEQWFTYNWNALTACEMAPQLSPVYFR